MSKTEREGERERREKYKSGERKRECANVGV